MVIPYFDAALSPEGGEKDKSLASFGKGVLNDGEDGSSRTTALNPSPAPE